MITFDQYVQYCRIGVDRHYIDVDRRQQNICEAFLGSMSILYVTSHVKNSSSENKYMKTLTRSFSHKINGGDLFVLDVGLLMDPKTSPLAANSRRCRFEHARQTSLKVSIWVISTFMICWGNSKFYITVVHCPKTASK